MSGLPREVLKWIQSLDLSYSVRNAKRDFSNGFMVAEILSRYYPADITMHSFDNGSSVESKTDNWNQLKKFFCKISFDFTNQEIEDIIHCYTSLPARPLVNRLYQAITNKKLKELANENNNKSGVLEEREKKSIANTPAYAYRTASNVLSEKFRGTDMNKTDTLTNQENAQNILSQHENALTQQKIANPDRFIAKQRASTQHKNRDLARGPTVCSFYRFSFFLVFFACFLLCCFCTVYFQKAVESNDTNMQQISFIKQVEVKKVNDSLLTIRNTHPAINMSSPTQHGTSVNVDIKDTAKANKTQSGTGDFSVMQSFRSPTHSINTANVVNSPKYESLVIISIDDIFIQCILSAMRVRLLLILVSNATFSMLIFVLFLLFLFLLESNH